MGRPSTMKDTLEALAAALESSEWSPDYLLEDFIANANEALAELGWILRYELNMDGVLRVVDVETISA